MHTRVANAKRRFFVLLALLIHGCQYVYARSSRTNESTGTQTCNSSETTAITSRKFDERPHRMGDFSFGKFNVAPMFLRVVCNRRTSNVLWWWWWWWWLLLQPANQNTGLQHAGKPYTSGPLGTVGYSAACGNFSTSSPQKCPFSVGDVDPIWYIVPWAQTASRSVQPILQGSRSLQTDRQSTLLCL